MNYARRGGQNSQMSAETNTSTRPYHDHEGGPRLRLRPRLIWSRSPSYRQAHRGELTNCLARRRSSATPRDNGQGSRFKKLAPNGGGNAVFPRHSSTVSVCSLIPRDGRGRDITIELRDNSYCIIYDPIDGTSNTDVTDFRREQSRGEKSAPPNPAAASKMYSARNRAARWRGLYPIRPEHAGLIVPEGDGVDIFTLDRRSRRIICGKK